MPRFSLRKAETDPATARYPEPMQELLVLGQPDEDTDYVARAGALVDYVPELIQMAVDEDLNKRFEDDPAVWAPIHALRLLRILRPAAAAEPLLKRLDWDDDWTRRELPETYGALGPVAIPLLSTHLHNSTNDPWSRGVASESLKCIAENHPAARDEVISLLTDFLDRASADDSTDEELATTLVIGDLADLKAVSAYDAIRRAFEEDRVDPQMVSLEEVEEEFGMRPTPDLSQRLKPRQEAGVRLSLKCTACGRERPHVFQKVYYDQRTALNKKKRDKYNPLVIPQHVICPKCGAVDQYELGGMGSIAVMASMLAAHEPEIQKLLREDQRIQVITFTTRWGNMHPQEAIQRYEREIARKPRDVSLRVGFGNVLRFIGYYEEARAQYEQAVEISPHDVEAWTGLADLAGRRQDLAEADRLWRRAALALQESDVPQDIRREMAATIRGALTDLRRGVVPELEPPISGSPRTAQPATTPLPQVGRNDPCPCGSGRKYKHCHGRR